MVQRTRSGSHLRQRGGVWYYRRVVPPHARNVFGRAEVAISLDTSDEKHAKRLERLHDADFERRLEEARAASDLDALGQRVAKATPIEIRLSSKWGGVSGEHVTDEDWLQAMSLANDHLLSRYQLLNEIADLLTPLTGDQMAECRSGILAILRQQVGVTTRDPVPVSEPTDVHTMDWTFDRWFRAKKGDRESGTIDMARRHWKAFIAHSNLPMLEQVKRRHLVAWRDSLVDTGQYRPKSINQRVQLVSAILRAGWRDAELAQPDLKAITLPEPDDSGRGAWTREEILIALNALPPNSWAAWTFLLALTTAVRLGEPIAAKVDWYDPAGFIHVLDRSATKANKLHALPIVECLREPLARSVKKRPATGYLFNAPRPADPNVSISKVASQWFQRFCKKNHINRVFHELRDTWIEEARHSPIDRDIWEIISGHSAATVSDRYGGKKPDVLLAANETICGFLTRDAEVMNAVRRLIL